jgi:hypothetical protein
MNARLFPTEYQGEGFEVRDASAALPTRAGMGYRKRNPKAIAEIVVHQTQGQTRPGFDGMLREGEYFVADRPSGRGWPGYAYTFFIPHRPERLDGRWVVYRGQPDDVVSYHTRGRSPVSVAVAFQGLFRCRSAETAGGPSAAQFEIFGPFLLYLCERYGLDRLAVFGHNDFGKEDCPGYDLERLVDDFRDPLGEPVVPLVGVRWERRQHALVTLGLLDAERASGDYDVPTRLAIERVQARISAPRTGHWTRPVDTFIRRELARRGVAA